MYPTIIKPILDHSVAFIGLVLLSPILVILTILLAISNKGNPFFMQYRPGKNERIFKLIKFRTMNNKRDESGNLLPDHKRLTGIGKFVRSTSLDELPQLINVVKGDMSLIGPRPLLVKYLDGYASEKKKRHNVKPGITGWAQINGWRGETDTLDKMEKRVEFDLHYIRNWSLWWDVKIIIKTLFKGFGGKDVY